MCSGGTVKEKVGHMKLIILFSIILAFSSLSFAGAERGGGSAIACFNDSVRDEFYNEVNTSKDMIEADFNHIESIVVTDLYPYVQNGRYQEIVNYWERYQNNDNSGPVGSIFVEIAERLTTDSENGNDTRAGRIILESQLFTLLSQSKVIADGPVDASKDASFSGELPENCKLFYVALNINGQINIDKRFFDKMDPLNKVALDYHEVILGLTTSLDNGSTLPVQKIVNKIFDPEFYKWKKVHMENFFTENGFNEELLLRAATLMTDSKEED